MSDLTDAQDMAASNARSYFYNATNISIQYGINYFPSKNEITGMAVSKHLQAFLDIVDYFGDVPTGFSMMNNSYPAAPISLTKTDLSKISVAVSQLCYVSIQKYDEHYQNIYNLTTIEDVNAYDSSTGYPTLPYQLNTLSQASYSSILNLDFGLGTLTGASVGGAVINSGYLDLSHNDVRYVNYSATGNSDMQQIGTIQFILKPNYSGTPSVKQTFIAISKANSNSDNLIELSHLSTSGNLELLINDSAGSPIVSGSLGSWSPLSGTDYIFNIHFDITTGNTLVKINNVTFGSVNTATGTRSSSIALLRMGNNYDSTALTASNFKIKSLSIINA